MNTDLYDRWIRSHQVQLSEFDVAELIMEQIPRKESKPDVIQKAWELFLLDFIQTKGWLRVGVLAGGAIGGLFRMMFVVYCGLFA